jgi:hypothetical protein
MGIYKNKTITQPKQKKTTQHKRKVLIPHLHLHLLLLLPLLLHITPYKRSPRCLRAHMGRGPGGSGPWVPSFLPTSPPSFFNGYICSIL